MIDIDYLYTLHSVPLFLKPNWEDLWGLRPAGENSSVLVKEGETYTKKQIFRKYKSYLRIPGFDRNTGKSYMFGDSFSEEERFVPLPHEIEPLHRWASWFFGLSFDQCVINWYDVGDYIEAHSDCTAKLDQDAGIVSISFYEKSTGRSFMDFEGREGTEYYGHESRELLQDGTAVYMRSKCQQKARHSVGPSSQKRVSVTFRKMK